MKFYEFIKFFKKYKLDVFVFLVTVWVVFLVIADLARELGAFNEEGTHLVSNSGVINDVKSGCINIEGLLVCD